MGLQTAHSLLPSWSWSELACSYETSIEGGSTQAATQLVDLFRVASALQLHSMCSPLEL